MRIALGRRQLVVSLVARTEQSSLVEFPMAAEASDVELARLNTLRTLSQDRARWESSALMYGAVRLRAA
jgi:hypothetical protein